MKIKLLSVPLLVVALEFIGVVSAAGQDCARNDLCGFVYSGGSYALLPDETVVEGINNSGEAVGFQYTATGAVGFTYENGVYVGLNVPGAISTYPGAINNLGQIVGGYVTSGLQAYVFSYSGSVFTTLSGVDGTAGGQQMRVNDLGEIIGIYGVNDEHNAYLYYLYSNGQYTVLDVPGSTSTQAIGLNNFGQVVGLYRVGPNSYGFIYSNGIYTTLDPDGSSNTSASGINDSGEIVGEYYNGTRVYGYIYSNGVYTTLDVPGSNETYGTEINNDRTVVGGYRNTQLVGNVFVYENGIYTTLPAIGDISIATGLNDNGQIGGYVLGLVGPPSPVVPEGSTSLLMLIGATMLAIGAYRRKLSDGLIAAYRSSGGAAN